MKRYGLQKRAQGQEEDSKKTRLLQVFDEVLFFFVIFIAIAVIAIIVLFLTLFLFMLAMFSSSLLLLPY